MKIRIKTLKGEVEAELNDSETAKKIYENLPIKGIANLWGEEIYFQIPLDLELEKDYSKQEMDVGDLAYWPSGNAFCIFFGTTPASTSEKPKAASEVSFIGKVKDIDIFKKVKEGEKIIIKNLV
jgi:hypothetical protein